ncbi:sulfurtransferase complex subunit TusD [Buchnera aphidicola]|uniref:sulfurtransferase complex subunit TusD n=1 Tax=Buchnera aphidicola TaxID=9 RepID=UPI0022375205|nr:sulfurtransferase complex subunit TusD [Buchnera aphidicola]MCW5197472.1 sulfurtransferase complex subunit TusD [Buchnera aphidicola (Chaitophorus viminalis)]
MIYTLIVKGPAYGKENSISALFFAKALISNNKHILKSIFFYCDGVLNANKFLSPAKNEYDIRKKWCVFSLKNQVRLNVCFSAALRRGIIGIKETCNQKILDGNLDIFFKISSLENLSRDIQNSDRVIQF